MIKIAILEDEDKALKALKDFLSLYSDQNNIKFQIDHFTNGVDFISDYQPVYDIVLMDIQMPMMDGLEVARRLRKIDKNVALIFVTNLGQYAINGYEVDAIDFIVKPFAYNTFSAKLKKAIDYVNRHSAHRIVLKVENSFRRIAVREIKYVEVYGHSLTYHTDCGDITVRDQLERVAQELEPYAFARCDNCYLVNLRYVTAVSEVEVMIGDIALHISRRRRKDFLQKLTNAVCGV